MLINLINNYRYLIKKLTINYCQFDLYRFINLKLQTWHAYHITGLYLRMSESKKGQDYKCSNAMDTSRLRQTDNVILQPYGILSTRNPYLGRTLFTNLCDLPSEEFSICPPVLM